MTPAYINRIGVAVPPFDIHRTFCEFAISRLGSGGTKTAFRRLADRAQIDHRYSFLPPESFLEPRGFYRPGQWPDTLARMRFFELHAPSLAVQALDAIGISSFKEELTHLIVACCTGFYAPGIDIDIVNRFDLKPTVERTIVGFMGCYAAINALKLARHIVRSECHAKVLVVNIELCTIHLQQAWDADQMLRFLIWGDGCATCLISAEPSGLELRSFHSTVIGGSADQLAWRVGQNGFDIVLSNKIARTLARELPESIHSILDGRRVGDIALWAVHPGGRSILDAVGSAIDLHEEGLGHSREILRRFGNMSSASVGFVLKEMLEKKLKGLGCAMAFGPGLTAESMIFEAAAG
jgi:predicted naringenin-chalcone synthase